MTIECRRHRTVFVGVTCFHHLNNQTPLLNVCLCRQWLDMYSQSKFMALMLSAVQQSLVGGQRNDRLRICAGLGT